MIPIEELEKVLQGCISRSLKKVGRKEFIDLFEHLDMANAEIARLRKAIEDAPHPIWCYANPEVNHRNLGPCDCWKSKALGEQNGTI